MTIDLTDVNSTEYERWNWFRNEAFIQSIWRDKYAIGGGVSHDYFESKFDGVNTYSNSNNFVNAYVFIKTDTQDDKSFPTKGIYLNAEGKILDVLTVIIFFLATIFDWSDFLFHGMALVYLYLSYPKHRNFYIVYMQKAKISTEMLAFLIMLACNILFLRDIIQHHDLAFLFYSLICMSFLVSALYVVFKKKFAQKMKRQMIMVIALALPIVGIYSVSLVGIVNSINDNSILSAQDVLVVNKEKSESSSRRNRYANYYLDVRMSDGEVRRLKLRSSEYYNTSVDGGYKMTLHKGNLGITWSAYELQ